MMTAPLPPPSMPMSDPEERIYRSEDFRVTDAAVVRPTPMYCGDKLSAVTFTMLPGQIHEAHSHTDMTQAWIILEGRGEAILGNGRRDIVGPGTMIVHHPEQLHGIVNVGDSNLVYINISERPPK
jgi:quercetin dioxygenase-like cupin family protein